MFVCLCIRELACGKDFVNPQNYSLRDAKEGNKNARMMSARVTAVIIVNVGQYEGDPH